MERTSSVWTRLAALCLIGLGCFHVFRALNLAITTDESFTFYRFVGVRWLDLLRNYDANHHVLHSVLCKLTIGLFGPSEWSLRLPAVLGGWLYFCFAWKLCRRLCGAGPAMLAGVLWMACLPQIAEYLSLARGYSLALGFWTAAMYYALDEPPRMNRVSALMGLSIVCNLVFVIPCAALGAILWLKTRATRALVAPALSVIVTFLAVPLQYASGENYYFGATSWESTVHSLLFYQWLKYAAALVFFVIVWLAGKDARTIWTLKIAACSLAIPAALFAFRDVPLPYERTGIYLLALLGMMAGLACRLGRLELPAALLASGAALVMTATLSGSRSNVWTFDAFNRRAVQLMREDAKTNPRVGASFPLERSLEFYRLAWRLPWAQFEQWRAGLDCDYLVWRTDEGQGPLPAGYSAMARDAASGVILGKRTVPPGH